MVLKTLDSKQKTQYVLRLDGIIIAAAVVSMEDDLICIIGVAVDIKYQNQGFGYQMMSMIITNLLKINVTNIMIEVDSLNQRAFHLYQKLGFVKQEENQYYRLKFEKRKCD
jgi:ribosomal protein S18 acetylase RimI-like enzyme